MLPTFNCTIVSRTWHCCSQKKHSINTVYVAHVGPSRSHPAIDCRSCPSSSEPPSCCSARPIRLYTPGLLCVVRLQQTHAPTAALFSVLYAANDSFMLRTL